MKNIKNNINFIAAALVAATIGLKGIEFINNIYTLELSNMNQQTQQHLELISNLE